jgi:hypothetical protein
LWYPGNFARYAEVHCRAKTESVDGFQCVVIDAVRPPFAALPNSRFTETLWLVPKLRYAPRKVEVRDRGVLVVRRLNSDFEEFAPGCWLPSEATDIGPPVWVEARYHDKAAFRYRITLRRAHVNQHADEWFSP